PLKKTVLASVVTGTAPRLLFRVKVLLVVSGVPATIPFARRLSSAFSSPRAVFFSILVAVNTPAARVPLASTRVPAAKSAAVGVLLAKLANTVVPVTLTVTPPTLKDVEVAAGEAAMAPLIWASFVPVAKSADFLAMRVA